MEIFRTHLIINNTDSKRIKNLELPNSSFILKNEPSNSYWESKDGKCFTHYFGGRTPEFSRDDQIPQKELLIEAETEDIAENLLSIIHGGMLLAYPEPDLTNNFVFLTPYKEDKDRLYAEPPFINYLKRLENIGFGCVFASIAVMDKSLIYAIEKYKISLELASFTPHSADPKYGQVFDNYDLKHNYQTRSAFAIISAFSVIEELGLEVRSSSKNPRFLNPDKGEWNPSVLGNIQDRLREIGITDDLTFDWVYRGLPTRIEQEIKPFFGFDSEWVIYGEEIRDKTLSFPEAIHNASFLRNYIAAHKFNDLTQYISPYDVFNLQLLARQLILIKMNLWESMINRKY